jgi:translation initiation factor IF-1
VIEEALPSGIYRVAFKNGHVAIGHLSKRDRLSGKKFSPGERVTVEMSPYDFSQGRIRV